MIIAVIDVISEVQRIQRSKLSQYISISVCLITSRLNIRTSLRLGVCIVCYSLTVSFVKSGNNLVEFKKKKVEMLGVSTLFY